MIMIINERFHIDRGSLRPQVELGQKVIQSENNPTYDFGHGYLKWITITGNHFDGLVYRPFLQVKWTKNGCFLRKFWFFVSSCSISIILGLLGLLVLGTLICVDKYRPNLRFTRLITRLSISRRVTSHRFKFDEKNLKPNDKIKLTQNQFKNFFTSKKFLKRKI